MHPVTSMPWKWCHLVVGHTLTYTLSKFEVNWPDGCWDISTFVSSPCFSLSVHYLITRDMASEPTPQQLITQSAQATANAIASVLTARMASISLPIYDWDSQDAYHSFSIFCHTLENWLLLNCIPPDSEDHLWSVFAALGTKSLEMHAQWMPTGIQHAWEQVSHSSKPVDAICQDKRWAAHISHNSSGHTPSAPSKDCPNCTWQHPASRASCPAHDSHCSKCDKMGHCGPKCHGGKPLQPRNTPPPGSQQRKSRCPPRNHQNRTKQTPYMSVRTTVL